MHEDDIIPGVIVNDNTRPSGNITFEERVRRINGIQLRNQLKEAISNHNMHRPTTDNTWYIDEYNHAVME